MRIGVLGAGRIGSAHITNLLAAGTVDELVVHDPSRVRPPLASSVTLADSRDELLGRVDGVVVATPTALHPDDVRAVAEAGLPCFCEKPISLDLATSRSTVAHVAAAGTELQVGFQRRFDPGFVEMKRLIDSGELGAVYLLRAASHDHEPPHESYLTSAGSIFADMHVHDFDALVWLSGDEPVEVFARGSVMVDDMFARAGDVDTSVAVITLAGGALAISTGTRQNGLGYDHRTEVIGSLDNVCAGFDARMPLRSADTGGPQPVDPYPDFPTRFRAAYAAEMAAFVDLVAGRGPNRCPGRAAVDALGLALAADRSLATGGPVPVADVLA